MPVANAPTGGEKGGLPSLAGRKSGFCVGMAMQVMELFIGPVIERDGGYCYQTFTLSEGLRTSFRYRRVEEARYDRRALIAECAANPCCRVREYEAVAKARSGAGPGSS